MYPRLHPSQRTLLNSPPTQPHAPACPPLIAAPILESTWAWWCTGEPGGWSGSGWFWHWWWLAAAPPYIITGGEAPPARAAKRELRLSTQVSERWLPVV